MSLNVIRSSSFDIFSPFSLMTTKPPAKKGAGFVTTTIGALVVLFIKGSSETKVKQLNDRSCFDLVEITMLDPKSQVRSPHNEQAVGTNSGHSSTQPHERQRYLIHDWTSLPMSTQDVARWPFRSNK
jgi:hypothetical protein